MFLVVGDPLLDVPAHTPSSGIPLSCVEQTNPGRPLTRPSIRRGRSSCQPPGGPRQPPGPDFIRILYGFIRIYTVLYSFCMILYDFIRFYMIFGLKSSFSHMFLRFRSNFLVSWADIASRHTRAARRMRYRSPEAEIS